MSKNQKIKFTVVIPTRERCSVLESALRTCVTQEYDNFEIIVSDNFSQDETKKMAESFKDNRIRYINTGRRMSMTDNWEFALAQARGDFITYLGDDDGLLPGALAELNEVIRRTGCEAVSCEAAGYYWPDHIDEYQKNILRVPLGRSLVQRDCEGMLNEVIKFRRDSCDLPQLYRGFVSHSVVKRVLEESGKFFHSMIPDIYASIALASVLESYYYSFKPYVISGASYYSNGAGSALGQDHQPLKNFLNEDNLPFHPKLAYAASGAIIVTECLLQVQDRLSCAKGIRVDIKKCIKMAVICVKYAPRKKYEIVVEAVKKIARLNHLEDYASGIIAAHRNRPKRFCKPVLGFNIIRNQITLDCAEFGVRNVYEAAQLCKHILFLDKARYRSFYAVLKTTVGLLKREILNCSLWDSLFRRI